MIRDILRFNREAPQVLNDDREMPLGEYLHEHRYSDEFIDHYIVPMGAAIWSSSHDVMMKFPARFFIRFLHNHGMLSVSDRPVWRTIAGGSARYVEKLTAPFRDRIRLRTAVDSIRRTPQGVLIKPQWGEVERYDRVFVACHSDQALRLLGDATPLEREVLGALPYQANEAVLHTDTSILPHRKLAWAAWNYHLDGKARERVALTYNMEILQSLGARSPLLVTLNKTDAIDPAKIIKRMTYEHPVFTPEGVHAQTRQAELNGVDRTYYCGAYWRNGFHEDGVVSAMNALAHFKDREHAQRTLYRTA
jgi:predicted NAD/FAD-binding protein